MKKSANGIFTIDIFSTTRSLSNYDVHRVTVSFRKSSGEIQHACSTSHQRGSVSRYLQIDPVFRSNSSDSFAGLSHIMNLQLPYLRAQ